MGPVVTYRSSGGPIDATWTYCCLVADTDLPIEPRGVLLITPNSASATGLQMDQIAVLSPEEHRHYQDAYQRAASIVFGGVLSYFQVSAQGLRAKVLDAEAAFAQPQFQPQTHPQEALQLISEIRSAVLSLASAVFFHQEQTYQRASDLHASDESTRAAVKTVFGQVFESSRGYRLLYSLRNVMTHHSMEVVKVFVQPFREADGQMRTRVDVTMNRAMATKAKKLNQVVRAELVRMREDPDVLMLLDDVFQPLHRVDQQLSALLYPELGKTCESIMELDSLFKGAVGVRALVNDWSPTAPSERPSWSPWAPQIFDFARRQLDR